MNAPSQLTERQIHGLEKIGDCLIPGDGELPSFSASGHARLAGRILDYMPEQDLGDLRMLLTVFSFLPRFYLRFFCWFLERARAMPGPAGSILRFIRIGVRGLVFSLYYSGGKPHDVIGYKVGVYTADLGVRKSTNLAHDTSSHAP